jgi:hypothetical protein
VAKTRAKSPRQGLSAPRAVSAQVEAETALVLLFYRIFFGEPVPTSPENALFLLFVAFSSANRFPLRRKML